MKFLLFLFVLLFVAVYKDYETLGVLTLLAIIIDIIYLICSFIKRKITTKKSESKNIPDSIKNISVKVSRSTDFYTKIAGAHYRNDAKDIGGFLGYVKPEPTNPYDKNAIAIYRNDGKLLGYIPKEETNDFREWSSKDFLPCVGYIKDGDEVAIYGRVKVLDTDPEEVELEVVKYVKWLIYNFGVEFIPSGFSVNTDETILKTADEWIALLEEYIDKKEDELYEEVE